MADIVGDSGLILDGTDGPHLAPGPQVIPVDAVPLAMLVADRGGRVQAVNERWVQVSGLSRAHSLGSGWLDALPEAERASLQAVVDQVAAGGPGRRLDYSWGPGEDAGRATWFLASIAGAGETLVGIAIDVHPPTPAAEAAPDRRTGSTGRVEDDPVRAELVGLLRSVDALLTTLDRVVDRLPVLELDVVPA